MNVINAIKTDVSGLRVSLMELERLSSTKVAIVSKVEAPMEKLDYFNFFLHHRSDSELSIIVMLLENCTNFLEEY
ncbi:hypothetical protein J437_LFUL017821 [Ladona fulva]|uniref:Uncharacterized protein n=1 Tax=Ladona fulva TaxID=123851 RepID=A0A8K0K7F1_LADFU|nr:hypothetical protein J437_LFUL017821 [Ladona fulva]